MADDDTALLVGALDDHEARLSRLEQRNTDLAQRCAELEARLARQAAWHGDDSGDLPLHQNRLVPWEVRMALKSERVPGIPVLWGMNPDDIPSGERGEVEARVLAAARLDAVRDRPPTTNMTVEQRSAEYRHRMLATNNAVYEALVAMAGDHEGIIADTPIRAVREVVFAELAEIKARLEELLAR